MGKRAARQFLRLLLILTLTGGIFLGKPSPGLADSLPASAYVNGVYGRPQSFNLSCESRSAVDWAAFFGVSISESDFLNRLGRSDNPDLGFVGNPNGIWGYTPPASYGVHSGPVAEVLRQYGVKASAKSGLTWDEVRAEIAAGYPVIVWVIGAMWGGRAIDYQASNGVTVKVAPFEHTMILVGYDQNLVYALDSASGYTQGYYTSSFLSSWGVLGNMAVIRRVNAPAPVPTAPQPTPAPVPRGKYRVYIPVVASAKPPQPARIPEPARDPKPATYTVQKGDHLLGIARQLGLDWQEIARLNNLWFPYILYPGQVLRLK